MMHYPDPLDELVQVAIILKRMVPDQKFSAPMAMVCAGISPQLAKSTDLNGRFGQAFRFHQQQSGPPVYSLDTKAKGQRYENFMFYAKYCPPTIKGLSKIDICNHIIKKNRADVIRIVGGTKDDYRKGPFYQRCVRIDDEMKKNPGQYCSPYTMPIIVSADVPVVVEPPYVLYNRDIRTSTSNIPRVIAHELLPNHTRAPSGLISPLSSRTPNSVQRTPEEASSISTAGLNPSSSNSSGRVPSANSTPPASIDNGSRRTVKQKHLQRKEDQETTQKRNACFMIGTQLVDLLKKGSLPGTLLTPVDIAESVNQIFAEKEEVFVSASELVASVKNGNVGCLPPPQGRPGSTPTHILEALADLFFSKCSIDQINAEKALTRPVLIELLYQVLESHSNDHTEAKYLFHKIEEFNATRQDIGVRDPREVIRFEWLTVTNLLKHFRSFEEMLVEKKYGRRATTKERERDGVEVVWFPGQPSRAGNIDEMSLSLDYSKNGAGGRPSATFTCTGVRSSGEPDQKSSYKVTILAGMTFGDEPLPPLIIIPSGAQEPLIRKELLKRFHQVHAQYGHSTKKWFDPMIATSEKGSITVDILRDYLNQIRIWYPDLADEDYKRFCLCIDSGPGRNDPQFLHDAAEMGVIISPKTPNTSEVTQEMDRLFALFKTILERNR